MDRWTVAVGGESTSALLDPAQGAALGAVLVLGHGASTHMEHRGMAAYAAELSARGLDVVRFNFLYTERGQGPPDRMPRLMECFAAVAEHARAALPGRALFAGGHSMGGRTASMLAAEGFPCDGLVLLAYPLHPAGQPEKLRDAHLPRIPVPVLCLNGTRDELCRRDLMDPIAAGLPRWRMHWVAEADHGFHVLKRSGRTDGEVLVEIGETVREWIPGVMETKGTG